MENYWKLLEFLSKVRGYLKNRKRGKNILEKLKIHNVKFYLCRHHFDSYFICEIIVFHVGVPKICWKFIKIYLKTAGILI